MSRHHCNYVIWCARYAPTSLHLPYVTRHREAFALLSGNLNRLVGLSGLSRYKPSTEPPTKWDYCSVRRVQCCFLFFLALRQGFASTSMSSSTWYWAFENFILRHPSYSPILETNTGITRVSRKYLSNDTVLLLLKHLYC